MLSGFLGKVRAVAIVLVSVGWQPTEPIAGDGPAARPEDADLIQIHPQVAAWYGVGY
ncbi:MAG: hypothetical protein GKR94_01670 [Gammaproteobacteria bacterium]|nr:hypothetical protein [Gammaproteobacteria bacterium]